MLHIILVLLALVVLFWPILIALTAIRWFLLGCWGTPLGKVCVIVLHILAIGLFGGVGAAVLCIIWVDWLELALSK